MMNSPARAILPALLAQLAEQLTLNQRVVGSSPTGGISPKTAENMARTAENKGFSPSATLPHPAPLSGTEKHSSAPQLSPKSPHGRSPRLAAVIDACDHLPEAIPDGIMAMIGAARERP